MQVNSAIVHLFKKAKLLKFVNVSTALSYNGRRFKIPIRKSVGYAHCLGFEYWMLKLIARMEKCLESGKAFVDVGTNVGQSLLIVKALYPSTRYLGFEPNPTCVEYTAELIRVNSIEDSTVYPFGLSDSTGTRELNFYHRSSDDATASVIGGFRNEEIIYRKQISVRRGDELDVWEHVKPGIIKIDAEGSELEVIVGLKKVIERYRPCIICEVLPASNQQQEFRVVRQRLLQEILLANRYDLYHIGKTGGLKALSCFPLDATMDSCNYLIVPAENTHPIS